MLSSQQCDFPSVIIKTSYDHHHHCQPEVRHYAENADDDNIDDDDNGDDEGRWLSRASHLR